jgi:hypothetical protein
METRPALLVRTERVTRRDEQIMARIIPSKYVVRDFVETGWGMAESFALHVGFGRWSPEESGFNFFLRRGSQCIHHYY